MADTQQGQRDPKPRPKPKESRMEYCKQCEKDLTWQILWITFVVPRLEFCSDLCRMNFVDEKEHKRIKGNDAGFFNKLARDAKER